MEDRYVEVLRNSESRLYRVFLVSSLGRLQVAALFTPRDAIVFAEKIAELYRLSVHNSTGERVDEE